MQAAVKRPEAYPQYAGVPTNPFDAEDVETGGTSKAIAAGAAHLRAGFVRKVFGILSAQLLLTALIAAPIVLMPSAGLFLARNPWVVTLSSFGGLALVLVLSLSESARNTHPTNLVLLAAFTALEGVVVGAVAAQYTLPSVALAVAVTGGVTAALAAYAAHTKTDYTARGGMLTAVLTALLFTAIAGAITRAPGLQLALAAAGSVIFGLYIVFDVQLLLGGAHSKFQLGPDEYVAGAIALYLDIINLFLHLLRLLGSERD